MIVCVFLVPGGGMDSHWSWIGGQNSRCKVAIVEAQGVDVA